MREQNEPRTMKTSVIICTRNRSDDLMMCLESIATQTLPPDEVLIVDGSDDTQSGAVLKHQAFSTLPVRYIHTEPGLTRQRNLGIAEASGDILFFFDDDVVLDKEYIEKVADVYNDKRLNDVGGVQGIDLNMRESFLEGKRRLAFHRLFLLNRNDEYAKLLPSGSTTLLDLVSTKIRYAKDPIRISLMSGCMMSFHRKVFRDLRFDENYDGYSHGEDSEFSHGVSRKHDMYFTSSAKAYHNQSQAKVDWYRTEDFVRSSMRAHVYLFRKHLRHNPLNYFAILWSWLGLMIWKGIIHPNKKDFNYYVQSMRKELLNIFRRIA